MDGETIEDLIRLSPEQILLRWVNYHLARAGIDRQIHNFGEDIKVSLGRAHVCHSARLKALVSQYYFFIAFRLFHPTLSCLRTEPSPRPPSCFLGCFSVLGGGGLE